MAVAMDMDAGVLLRLTRISPIVLPLAPAGFLSHETACHNTTGTPRPTP